MHELVSYCLRQLPTFISICKWAVVTIHPHVIPNNTLPSGSIAIRIDKPPHHRVIVSALEVIEPGFLVVHVSTVAQGVDACQGSRCRDDLAIGIVVIAGRHRTAGVHNAHYVALEIGDVIVHRAVVLHGVGCTIGIIEEVNGIGSPGHAHQLAAGVVVAVGGAVHGLAGSQAAGIISKAQVVGSIGDGGQSPTIDPGKVPAGAIVVAGGVANGIVSNAVAVKGSEQILPGGVTVGVGVPISSQDVARAIVGIGVGGVPRCAEQLTLVVVGVGNGAFSRGRIGGDVTHAVIGIAILLPAAGHGRHLQYSLDGRQLSLIISILHGSGICNDYNQKKCPGKIQDTSCGGWNLQ